MNNQQPTYTDNCTAAFAERTLLAQTLRNWPSMLLRLVYWIKNRYMG